MSFLDALITGNGDATAEALAELDAAITAQAVINTEQAEDIATLTTQVATATSVNATQTTAIAANTAANASQGSAITALQSLTAGHVAAIAKLQEKQLVFDVRDSLSATLSNSTIDDAIDIAITAARAATSGVGLLGPGATVRVPRGRWDLAIPHEFPAPGVYEVAVSFEGAGQDETIFRLESDAESSPAFTFGTEDTGTPMPHNFYLRVRGFAVVGVNGDGPCRRNGLRFYGPVNPVISDIRVRGLRYDSNAVHWSECIGIEILECVYEGQRVNSQFVRMRDMDVFGCMTGLRIVQAGPLMLDTCHIQGNRLYNAVLEGALGTWRDSGVQFGQDDAGYWWGGRRVPGVVTGWSRTAGLPAGSGATCGTASAGLCTVTGLSGLLVNPSSAHIGMWLELTPAGSSSNELKTGGIYKIAKVLSDSSCIIHKGSNHTAQGSLTWQMRQAAYGSTMVFENLYDEVGDAGRAALLGVYASPNSTSTYEVRNTWFSASAELGNALVEARNCGRVSLSNNNIANRAKYDLDAIHVGEVNTDGDTSRIKADGYTRTHVVSRRAGNTSLSDAGYPRATRLIDIVRELDGIEGWDARRGIEESAGDVLGWTGFINGTVAVPRTAAVYTEYVSSEPLIGGPCVRVPDAGVGGVIPGLTANISSSLTPGYDYQVTVFCIARMPTTALSGGGRRIEARGLTTGCATFMFFYEDYSPDSARSLVSAFYDTGLSVFYVPTPPTTDVRAWAMSPASRESVRQSLDLPDLEYLQGTPYSDVQYTREFSPSETLQVNMFPYNAPGGSPGDMLGLDIVHYSVMAHAKSEAQLRGLINAARREFPLLAQ